MAADPPLWTDIIVAMTAIYAAGLSTYNLIEYRRDKRPQVRLILYEHVEDVLKRVSRTHRVMNIAASNPGNRPVTISMIGLATPNGDLLTLA